MGGITAGELFPSASLRDIDGQLVAFPFVFASVTSFYRGRF